MKKFAAALLVGILITTTAMGYSENLSEELAQDIIRLHIVANSNSLSDQNVKLKIRDELLLYMENYSDKKDVLCHLADLERKANNILKEEGFSYSATAEYGDFNFPTKYYDGFALPKGKYKAVKINLGKATGENWWCVLFPPLCMVDAATGGQEKMLRETFGENYSVIAQGQKPKFNIKFRLAEIF